ncbi:MAG TPA: DNA polymerase III subunit alpha [Actinobacteria bacterium]|nr:DNA polymerase III subunit alpha [Actinomycetota bacterium]
MGARQKRSMTYAELHCHTNFSFLDGASPPEELVERAVALGYRALAVTDHNGFYGAVRFSGAARGAGLPAVYGVEIGLAVGADSGAPLTREQGEDAGSDVPVLSSGATAGGRGTRPRRRGRTRRMHGTKPVDAPQTDHLVLLAPSADGYAALSRFVTRAQFRGEKDRPVYTWRDLEEAARGGLYALTGCHHGAVPRAAQIGDLEGALREAAHLREVFGHRLHVEMWHHAMPEDDPRNDLLWDVARRLRLPVVATNNVHYADRSDADLADVLAAIGGRRSLDDADGYRSATDERYLKDPSEMVRRFARYRGAVERAGELGDALSFDLRLVAPKLPDFPMPGHFRSEMEYLRYLTFEGARGVYPGSDDGVEPRARERLEHELDVIGRLGFPGYFLVVWDIVNFARSQDIYCQIRGSGADSAVCRCIGLTRVDPIRLHLPFERFLSDERGRPPDIDLDLEAERREEVIQYCYRRYGRERAAMVANVITYRARSVLRDVGKAFGLTQAQVDGLSKYVDTRNPAKLRLEAPLPAGMTAEFIYDVCHRLDGFPRHLGIHSSGMVIADRPLWQVVPMEWGRMQDRSVLQWDKDDCAAIGIVKFDLLALGMLNALHLTVDTIADAHGVVIDLATIPQEPAIYEMLTTADTVGVFQVESRAQMATLPKMKPKTFYDLAVEVALIRPGPIQGQSVHPYLRRRNGEDPVRYPHPSTEPILAKTLGVPIFQEQLMELARVCAGFDGSQSDRLRSAMTHKRSDEAMGKLRTEVFAGMARNGITGPAADEIWEKLQGFASFGFPESHSVSFAYIVYMSAWLKYHWPTEFLAGLLNAYPMGFYSPNTLVQDAQRHGVVVLEPDVNRSSHDCTVEPYDADADDVVTYYGKSWRRGRGATDDPVRAAVALRMGLRYVRNLGEAEIGRIEAARLIGGAFRDVRDLAQRTGLPVDAFEGLAAAGALGSLGVSRREGLWAAGSLAEIDPERLALAPGVDAPALPGMNDAAQHRADLWATGVSPRHPVEFVREWLDEQGCVRIADVLERRRNGWRARVGGIVTHRQRPGTANGVVFFNIEDETGLLNVVVLPEVWQTNRETARRNVGLVVEGVVEYRDGVTNLVARGFTSWPVEGVRSRDFR